MVVIWFNEYAGRLLLKKYMYSSMFLIESYRLLILKSAKNSSLIQPSIASTEALSAGVPALGSECTILYKGKSSLWLFDDYTEHRSVCGIKQRFSYFFLL